MPRPEYLPREDESMEDFLIRTRQEIFDEARRIRAEHEQPKDEEDHDDYS